MFGKEDSVDSSTTGINSLLGPGSHFKGEIRAQGVVQIDARFEGAIESTARVMIGSDAVVDAEIKARHVIVAGHVRGSIAASDRLELQSGCRVEADLRTARLTISEGAYFQGRCDMPGNAEDQAPSGAEAGPSQRPLRVLG